jgi:hypothetical protein
MVDASLLQAIKNPPRRKSGTPEVILALFQQYEKDKEQLIRMCKGQRNKALADW